MSRTDSSPTGSLSCEFDGKRVQYRSLDEMMRIRETIRGALGLSGSGKRFSSGGRKRGLWVLRADPISGDRMARGRRLPRVDHVRASRSTRDSDHDGGAPELSRLIPIRTFIDYGEATEKGKKVQDPYDAYARVRKTGANLEPKVGDTLPLKGIEVQIVSGRGKTLTAPLSGAGQDNPACTVFKKKANDFTENARSFGFRLVYGRFKFIDLGDLVWNELGQLVCPKNMLGDADVYLVAHHGNAFSGVPAVTEAMHPRVAIVNNGEVKGGDAKTFKVLHASPGLEDIWQLHRTTNQGARQADEAFIANLDVTSSYSLKLSASVDGGFSITNRRTSVTKRYAAK